MGNTKLAEGFYHLRHPTEAEPTLVHGYNCTDMDGEFVFGFNIHDGGGLLPLSDISAGTVITSVQIVEPT